MPVGSWMAFSFVRTSRTEQQSFLYIQALKNKIYSVFSNNLNNPRNTFGVMGQQSKT